MSANNIFTPSESDINTDGYTADTDAIYTNEDKHQRKISRLQLFALCA